MQEANKIRAALDRISDKLARHGDTLTAEDAIKTVLVSPMLTALGHDPSDPDLVQVGQKTSEGRADYTVLDAEGRISLLVAISSNPDDHDSARARSMVGLAPDYQVTGLLTDGKRHRFHLLSSTGLTAEPFLSFNVGDDIDPGVLLHLTRENFDIDAAVAAARTTRPADIAWDYLLEQVETDGVIHAEVTAYLVNQGVSDERAASGAMNALRKIGRILRGEELAVEPAQADDDADDDRRPLTGDEIAAMDIIKQIVGEYVDPDLVVARQAQSYLALNYTDNNRRTICRLYLQSQSARYIGTFIDRKEKRERIQTYEDVAQHAEAILRRLRELDPGAFRNKRIEAITPAAVLEEMPGAAGAELEEAPVTEAAPTDVVENGSGVSANEPDAFQTENENNSGIFDEASSPINGAGQLDLGHEDDRD